MSEYRVDFSITRRDDHADDFTEIGFGSSGAWDDLEACTHWIGSAIANGEWETTPGMPVPDEVLNAIREKRS